MAVLAIDWDNTLIVGETWLPGAIDAMNRLRELGHKVCIHSCNNPGWIEKQCREAGVVVDHIWEKKHGSKPLADLYVDDKGYHFPYNGDWNDELPQILLRIEGLDNRKW